MWPTPTRLFVWAVFSNECLLGIFSILFSGLLMVRGVKGALFYSILIATVKKINLEDVSESFPAFITMITMVLCYSIADGICLGILSYVIIKLCAGKWKNLNVTLVVLALLLL